MAETDRETAKAMARIDSLQESQTRDAIADLGAQQAELVRLRGDLQIAFQQAANQRVLLVKVANLKRIGLQRRRFGSVWKRSSRSWAIAEMDLRNLNTMVKRIVDKDFAASSSGGKRPVATARTQAGIEILRGYLDATLANKEKSDVVKK